MHLVQIDVIHLEAAPAFLDFRHDMPAREADLIGRNGFDHENIGVEADFCGDDQIFTPIAEDAPENFFRRTRRINIGGIEEIATDFNESIENFSRSFFVCFTSKRHASKKKLENFEPNT